MNAQPTPNHEPSHARALRWMNTPEMPDRRVAQVLRLVQVSLDVPVVFVSLESEDGPLVQAGPGITDEEVAEAVEFFGAAQRGPGLRIVDDVLEDESFQCGPRVVGEREVRFYVDCPLHSPDGTVAGALCLMDRRPRTLSEREQKVLSEVVEIAEAEVRDRALETVDPITNLSNRRGFLFIAGQVLALRDRSAEPVSLVSLEVERAGPVGKRPGRETTLRTFGRLLLDSFRDSDVVARLYGNEFCVLVCPDRPDDVDIPIGRLEEAVDAWNRSTNGEHTIRFRHGVIEFDSEEDGDLDGLLAAAEAEAVDRVGPGAEIPPAIGGAVSVLRLLEKRGRFGSETPD